MVDVKLVMNNVQVRRAASIREPATWKGMDLLPAAVHFGNFTDLPRNVGAGISFLRFDQVFRQLTMRASQSAHPRHKTHNDKTCSTMLVVLWTRRQYRSVDRSNTLQSSKSHLRKVLPELCMQVFSHA